MKNFLLILILSQNIFSQALAQETKIILIRHAEKESDGTKDPNLNEVGKARAERLASTLENMKIDALYSTPYKRTKGTIMPLSLQKDLKIMDYNPSDLSSFVEEILDKEKGKSIVICGHSNTTPALANLLLNNETFEGFKEDEYNNLIIIVIPDKGKPILIPLAY